MPVSRDYLTHRGGLDSLAGIGGVAPGLLVAPQDAANYCLLQLSLVDGRRRLIQERDAPTSVFEANIRAALTHADIGAFVLQRGLYACPTGGDGPGTANVLWHVLTTLSTVPDDVRDRPDATPNSWLRGDAIYIHYPVDNGLTFIGAVIEQDGDALPVWQ